MIVGGNDVIIEARPGTPIAAVILESVRHYWPDSVFQDAEEDDVHSIHDGWVLNNGSLSKEFFIYRDRDAVESWNRLGATPANLSKMLYFIIGDQPTETETPWETTLVCGRKTRSLQRFIEDLRRTLRSVPHRFRKRAA